jgi:hypothetical protein
MARCKVGSRGIARWPLLALPVVFAATLWAGVYAVADDGPAASAETQPAPIAPYPEGAQGQSPPLPWLDEVRAQRHAWEERRRAAREAFDARRRASDTWGAAQQDAWSEEVERRREARRQRREDQREHFREMGPPGPPAPWPDHPGAAGEAPALSGPPSAPAEAIYPPGAPPSPPYAPQDWDNPWYYRGY